MNQTLNLLQNGQARPTSQNDNEQKGKGGKTGKNHFLLYIDIDPDPGLEFTLPGVISVYKIYELVNGPNYTHLSTPIM